jgi:hypothetical protein
LHRRGDLLRDNQITVRICIEYFSVFHPTILALKSPTLLALQWGILATWWVGAFLGVSLAIAAREGSRIPLRTPDLLRPIGILLMCMFAGAAICRSNRVRADKSRIF